MPFSGSYLVSAHAMNGGGPTAQILEREGWKFEKDFVGHRKAVTCVRFNDNIFEKELDGPGSKKAQFVCLAIGSRDRSMSVWLTSLKRPLFVIHDVFESSILDLSWSSDDLICHSSDWTTLFEEYGLESGPMWSSVCRIAPVSSLTPRHGL